jgi:hypothetical protein
MSVAGSMMGSMLPAADLLDFEQKWGAHTGNKEEAIRRDLGVTPARYYQLLDRVIETPEALASHPLLTHRLLRIRDARRQERAARRSA